MIDQIISTIEEYRMLQQGDHVTVGLSGGADSVALLCILRELAPRYQLILSACHVNHQLRGEEGDADEEFCKHLCEEMKIPIVVQKIEVERHCKGKGLSIEMGARQLRYEALSEASPGKIATAHHADDNAETVLINLLRGTSLDGLCGIAPVRGRIIRPLLAVNRAELEAYLARLGQAYRTDGSNVTDAYLRNRLRHHVIPLLQKENPAFSEGILRMTMALRRDRELLDQMAREILRNAALPCTPRAAVALVGLPLTPEQGRWFRAALLAHPQPLRLRALRLICTDHKIAYDQARLLLLDRFLTETGTMQLSPEHRMTVSEATLSLEAKLSLVPPPSVSIRAGSAKTQHFSLPFGRTLIVRLFHGEELKLFVNNRNFQFENLLDCDKIDEIIKLRSRQSGDFIRLFGRDATKSLKKLMNEAGIPSDLRSGLVLLADEKGPVWLEGFGVCERAAISLATQRAIFLEIQKET